MYEINSYMQPKVPRIQVITVQALLRIARTKCQCDTFPAKPFALVLEQPPQCKNYSTYTWLFN